MRCVSLTRTTYAAVAPASRMRGTMSRHDCSVSAVSASLRCRWFTTTVTAQPYSRTGRRRKLTAAHPLTPFDDSITGDEQQVASGQG